MKKIAILGSTGSIGTQTLEIVRENDDLLVELHKDGHKCVNKVDFKPVLELLEGVKITAICDVTNPLLGNMGATYIFSPQKGAKEEDLKVFVEGYSNKVNELSDSLIKVCETIPNAKIKALGEQIKGNVAILNNEINEKLEQGKNEFANVKEKVSLIDIQGKYDELLNELKALKEKIEYGEREETTND